MPARFAGKLVNMNFGEIQGPFIADVAALIFSFLDIADKQSTAQVCRFWRSISYLPSLWRDVTVILPLDCTEELVRSLNRRKITRVNCSRANANDLSFLFSYLPGITHLSLSGCPHVTELFLKREIPKLYELQQLSFRRCCGLSDAVLEACGPCLKKLTSFTLEDCDNITEIGFKNFVKHLCNLEVLDLTWCEGLTDGCLKTLGECCVNIFRLSLRGCDWVTEVGVRHLVENLKELTELDFKWSHGINDATVKLVTKNLPGIDRKSVV